MIFKFLISIEINRIAQYDHLNKSKLLGLYLSCVGFNSISTIMFVYENNITREYNYPKGKDSTIK